MSEHPIQGIMDSTMQKIKEMVDVNTIVGDPMSTPDGATIIPISKVSFGFVSGGSDLNSKQEKAKEPFAGGSGAGISINPVGFIVIKGEDVRMLQISNNPSSVDKLIDMAPDLIERLKALIAKQ
jgi:sporulation protein YtfJ